MFTNLVVFQGFLTFEIFFLFLYSLKIFFIFRNIWNYFSFLNNILEGK